MAKRSELDGQDAIATRIEDIESSPQGIVRRWLAELDISDRTEKSWRAEAREIIEIYEGAKARQNSFNILWSNTDTLSPALYNSTPVPDVRRRFRDADPVGKAASNVIERSLAYNLDQFDCDREMKNAVLDLLLPGRAVLRVRYQPLLSVMPSESTPSVGDDGATPPSDAMSAVYPLEPAKPAPPPPEKIVGQTVPWEHVKWDDFRRGPGKSWGEVPWIAFRHDFTREMAEAQFGAEIAEKLTYSQVEHSEDMGGDVHTRRVFKTVEVWEIWDKEQRRVLFVAPCYKDAVCKLESDPLGLVGFFPAPAPAMAVENSNTLEPIPLYRLYKEQARELDNVSARINKIVKALKVRGAYASNLPELREIINADDGSMTPVANVSEIATRGGLDNAIWIMPIEKLAAALKELYLAREQIKQTIYEITGISDIVRGSSVASETATAQRLKNQWGSLRLQRMQREVQRLIRDCMRIQGEIIAEHFTQEQLAQTTNVQLPTAMQKQQAMAVAQQIQLAGQQQPAGPPAPGAPPAPAGPPQLPPEIQSALSSPTWEDVMGLLQSDGTRSVRIDIETDSTIADMVDRDMKGLAELTESLGQLVQGTGPAVMSGMLPVDAVKEIALTMTRRARMGNAVEDALEKIQAPAPQMQPEQMKEIEAGKQEIQKGKEDMSKQQLDFAGQQIDFFKNQAAEGGRAAQQYAKVATDAQAQVADRGPIEQVIQALAQTLMQSQQQMAVAADKVDQVATIVQQSNDAQTATVTQALQSNAETMAQVMAVMAQVIQALQAPKVVSFERGKDGRITQAVASPTLQ